MWSSLLVGAIPRMGKTFAARIPVAGAALDPHVRLIVAEGKGGRDWKAFARVTHWYGFGVRAAVVEALVELLRGCVADMNRRYEVMAGLPDDLYPESKVTPALARNRRYDMPLTLIALDEVQRYLEHPAHGEEIADLLTDLVKVGPAAGYMLVLATQKPDSKTIPPKLRDNTGTRFALKVMNWQSSEAILGAGTYSDGLDASKLLRRHKGVGILLGADDGELADEGGQTVRTHLMDRPTLTGVIERARALRIEAGTLTGTAAGEEVITERPTARLLDDVLTVFEAGEARLWSETVCARLAETNPDAYSGWEPTTLAKALKGFGVDTKQIEMPDPDASDGRRRNRKGIERRTVLDALTDR